MSHVVLLVDDDVNLSEGLRRVLRHEPYRVLTANSGDQALEIIAKDAVDVVVSDEQMPGMGGLELLTTIRRHRPDIVSLMLSGQSSMGTVVRALNSGQIFRFLIKPCNQEEITTAIRQALAHHTMLLRCRLLLPVVRRQSEILNAVERKHPGLLANLTDRIPIGKEDATDEQELSELMDVEIRRGTPTTSP